MPLLRKIIMIEAIFNQSNIAILYSYYDVRFEGCYRSYSHEVATVWRRERDSNPRSP